LWSRSSTDWFIDAPVMRLMSLGLEPDNLIMRFLD